MEYKLDATQLKPSFENKIKQVILVASGKGGVGKSMVASNLSVALARDGYKTGLLDADLYGPSTPLYFGLENPQAKVDKENGKDIFLPVESYGVKTLSLGFYINKEDALIWRGPKVTGAINQLMNDTKWGELDFLVIDMPPGTGDICLTIAQNYPSAKALIVITPQQMAVADGRKSGKLFQSTNIDILGVVENMSWFTPEKHPDEKYLLFGSGGGRQLADELDVPLLSQIPLISDVCELSDAGKTVFSSAHPLVLKTFENLAVSIQTSVSVSE